MRVMGALLVALVWGFWTAFAFAQIGGLSGNSETPGVIAPAPVRAEQLLPPLPTTPAPSQIQPAPPVVQGPPASRPSSGSAGKQPARAGVDRSEIPPPPTAVSPARTQPGGGWVTGEAALAGGPFPAYMTGYAPGQTGAGWGGATSRPPERPFSDYSRPASVSPYLNLYRPQGALGTAGNYYSLVRPMVEQQQTNRQFSQRLRQVESAASATGGYAGRPAPTGGYFMNYYGFFPGLGAR